MIKTIINSIFFMHFLFTISLLDFENRCQIRYEVSLVIHLCIFGLTTVDLGPKIHISNTLFCNLDINKKICFSHHKVGIRNSLANINLERMVNTRKLYGTYLFFSKKKKDFTYNQMLYSKNDLSYSESKLTDFLKKHPMALGNPDLQLEKGRLLRENCLDMFQANKTSFAKSISLKI